MILILEEGRRVYNKLIQMLNSTEINLSQFNNVLLQTARAKVYSVNEKQCKNLRILFDSGSQLSYITPRARNALDLQTVDQKEIAIKVFGKTEETKTLDRVNICIKSRDSNLNIYMSQQCLFSNRKSKYKYCRGKFPGLLS